MPEDAEIGILHPCLLRIQCNSDELLPHYLRTLLSDSDLLQTQIAINSNATTIEVIYSYTIANVIIPVPPLDEQKEIMAYLDGEVTKLEILIAKSRRSIDLLREHRTALISAAVTGKIDVREAA